MQNKIIILLKKYLGKIKSLFSPSPTILSDDAQSTPKVQENNKTMALPIDKRRAFIRNALVGATGVFVANKAMANHEDEYSGWREQGHGASEWDELNNKPTEFNPKAHGHPWSQISSIPSIVLWGEVSSSNAASKVVQRTSSGDIHGREFTGISTKARYADLAEKYEPDAQYEEGDVLAIGGDKEVTLYRTGMPLAGVVSVKPAFKMNDTYKTEGWPYIALKGRIPVKIKGAAEKGDLIIADTDGKGIAIKKENFKVGENDLIGVSLQNGSDLVEVKV